MSDLMLHEVLVMPADLWDDSETGRAQRYSRYLQASRKIEDLNRALIALSSAYSDWAMNVSDEDELLITKMIQEAERI